jgi:hypothetical protein
MKHESTLIKWLGLIMIGILSIPFSASYAQTDSHQLLEEAKQRL